MTHQHSKPPTAEDDATTTQEQALAVVRSEIDHIDREIQRLLNERARCAQKVAEIKAHFESQAAVFYRPEREVQVLRAVMARNEGPLPDAEVARLFREIMSVCLAHEQPLTVVYTGSALAESAAMKHFGHSAHCTAQANLEAVFTVVQQRQADYAVVPIEPLEASLQTELLQLLARFDLTLCGEVELCRHQAGRDGHSDNCNSFLVLGRQLVGPSGQDKTALLLRLALSAHESQALVERQLAVCGLAPGHLMCQRVGKTAQTLLYVELAGHRDEATIARVISALDGDALELKLLGSFPCAVL